MISASDYLKLEFFLGRAAIRLILFRSWYTDIIWLSGFFSLQPYPQRDGENSNKLVVLHGCLALLETTQTIQPWQNLQPCLFQLQGSSFVMTLMTFIQKLLHIKMVQIVTLGRLTQT